MRPPTIRGDKEMCEHIVECIEQECEEQKSAETFRDANRLQLLKTLQRRHEACNALEKKAGVKRSKAVRPNTTIDNPVVGGEKDLEEETVGERLQMTYNTARQCGKRLGESQIIKKLKEPRPVSSIVIE